MEIKIQRLRDSAVIPSYAKDGDAGLDLTAVTKNVDLDKDIITYGFGIALEIPKGYVGLIFPRSSCFKTDQFLTNCVGVVSSNCRGEISAKFKNATSPNQYEVGDRAAQIIIMPIPTINFIPVRGLSKTERGSDGYGSTGK